MTNWLPPDILRQFASRVAASAHPRELVVDLLRAVQATHGWVPDAAITASVELLGLSEIEIEEVATFYDKIFRQPVGKRVIFLCDAICCWSNGSETLAAQLKERLGIGFGETTGDGLFTLLPSGCLGACGQAPVLMIGFELHGRLTPEKLDALLDEEQHRFGTTS